MMGCNFYPTVFEEVKNKDPELYTGYLVTFLRPGYFGGISTLSITWITPFFV